MLQQRAKIPPLSFSVLGVGPAADGEERGEGRVRGIFDVCEVIYLKSNVIEWRVGALGLFYGSVCVQ